MQKLQCTKPSNQQLSSALQDDKTLANSEPDFLQLEESMDTFLDAAQEFGQLFQQVCPRFIRLKVGAAVALLLLQMHSCIINRACLIWSLP